MNSLTFGSRIRRFAKQCNRSFHRLHLAFSHNTGYTRIGHTASAPLYDAAVPGSLTFGPSALPSHAPPNANLGFVGYMVWLACYGLC